MMNVPQDQTLAVMLRGELPEALRREAGGDLEEMGRSYLSSVTSTKAKSRGVIAGS